MRFCERYAWIWKEGLSAGVYDNGKISGMKVDDALMKRISGIRSDGNI